VAFAAAPLRYSLAPKALDLLVIDCHPSAHAS
jgi:hypothetical protein